MGWWANVQIKGKEQTIATVRKVNIEMVKNEVVEKFSEHETWVVELPSGRKVRPYLVDSELNAVHRMVWEHFRDEVQRVLGDGKLYKWKGYLAWKRDGGRNHAFHFYWYGRGVLRMKIDRYVCGFPKHLTPVQHNSYAYELNFLPLKV